MPHFNSLVDRGKAFGFRNRPRQLRTYLQNAVGEEFETYFGGFFEGEPPAFLGNPFSTSPNDQSEFGLAITAYNNAYSEHQDDAFDSRIYKPLLAEDKSVITTTKVSSGLFTGGVGTLTGAFSSSTAGDTTASYIEIFDKNPQSDTTAEVQYALGYAHFAGSGSIGNTTKTTAGNRESAALYRQFSNVILSADTEKFTFTGAPTPSSSGYEHFYFIVFNRAQMREKVDPGNWELRLSGSAQISLIDDSGATTVTDVNQAGRVFNVVSGSITNGVHTAASAETTFGAPGLFYPDLGIILLNPLFLSGSALTGSRPTTATATSPGVISPGVSTNAFDENPRKLYNHITASSYFQVRREEEINSRSYFCRALNKEYNYSNNPTYETSDSNGNRGKFTIPSFVGDPRTYITQVGLYDDNFELIAVAKLSQPQLKSFSREAVVKVKLDY
tara:strand:- start:27 stop:1358 length:1332 start_codon:yes stop_codon:yes gene_type:complete